jgi:hypothetical protein
MACNDLLVYADRLESSLGCDDFWGECGPLVGAPVEEL